MNYALDLTLLYNIDTIFMCIDQIPNNTLKNVSDGVIVQLYPRD